MSRDPVGVVLASYPVVHHALKPRAPSEAGAPVSEHQATVLAHLDRGEPRTLTELALAMRVALPTMSLLIDRLSGAGLVRRDRDPKDRRRVRLRLSAAGERVVAGRSLVDPDRVRALFAVLDPAERIQSAEGLATLARAARRLVELEIRGPEPTEQP